jgi:hypothetical protein
VVTNSSTEINEDMISSTHTLGLKIGSVSFTLKCKEEAFLNRLKTLYHNFLTDQPADITVELEEDKQLNADSFLDLSTSDIKFMHENGNSFRTSSQLMSGQYDLTNRVIKLTGARYLLDPDIESNRLNQLLSLSYYSACKVKFGDVPPAMLVYSCGIIRHGKALIFAGPNESGKTTIAGLCRKQNGEVLNDEIVLMSRPNDDGEISVQSAPMLSQLSPRANKSAPLSCILFIKKSDKTVIHDIPKTEAYLRFMRQIITPAYIGQSNKRAVYTLIADFSNEVTQKVPVYELEFSLNGESLWREISKLEGILRKCQQKR